MGGLVELWRSEKPDEWLLRLVALYLLALSIEYWMRLVGVFPGSQFRFDTMNEHWRLAASVMAVALPVTALGLWSKAAWGIVLWFPIVAVEGMMYGWLTPTFGRADIRLSIHFTLLFLFLAIRLAERYRQYRRERLER